MNISSLFKYPAYIYNPKQILIRIGREFSRPRNPMMVSLPWGHRLSVNPNEFIGHAIWQQGIHEINVCEAIARLVQPGDTVLDVGANIGFMTSLLAKVVGPTGRVIAFEPHPELYAKLRENIAGFLDQTCGSISAENIALSDANGESWLTYEPETFARNSGTAGLRISGSSRGSAAVKVQTRTIDSIIGENVVSLIKLDVEGAEMCVLRGAQQAFKDGRIKAIVYEDFKSRESGIAELLRSIGYSVFYLDGSLTRPTVHPVESQFQTWRRGVDENFLAVVDAGLLLKQYRNAGWRVFKV